MSEIEDDMPEAVSESIINLGAISLRVYQLDDGRRVINADDIHKLIEAIDGGVVLSGTPEEYAILADALGRKLQ